MAVPIGNEDQQCTGLTYGNPLARFKMLGREVRLSGSHLPPLGFDFQVHETRRVDFFPLLCSSFLKPLS